MSNICYDDNNVWKTLLLLCSVYDCLRRQTFIASFSPLKCSLLLLLLLFAGAVAFMCMYVAFLWLISLLLSVCVYLSNFLLSQL